MSKKYIISSEQLNLLKNKLMRKDVRIEFYIKPTNFLYNRIVDIKAYKKEYPFKTGE